MKFEINKQYFFGLDYGYDCSPSKNFIIITRSEERPCGAGRTKTFYIGVSCSQNGKPYNNKEYLWSEDWLESKHIMSMDDFFKKEVERKKAKIVKLQEKVEKLESKIKTLTNKLV